MSLARQILLVASRRRGLGERARRWRFTRRAVRRFMPGEQLSDALVAGEELRRNGISSMLHELGENVETAGEAEAAAGSYEVVLQRIAAAGLDGQVSLKLTHLGLDVDAALARDNLLRVVDRAEGSQGFVWIDMESSAYVDRTLEIFRAARARSARVGVCLQAYLRRTAGDLEALLPLGPTLRLVKGAYDEPASLAFPKKRDTDANFLSLASRLLQEDARRAGARLCAATHDRALLQRIGERARGAGLGPEDYEIQMLYGIQGSAQVELARRGHRVRVLISYGPDWFPWFMRRLAERPANLLFLLRNLV